MTDVQGSRTWSYGYTGNVGHRGDQAGRITEGDGASLRVSDGGERAVAVIGEVDVVPILVDLLRQLPAHIEEIAHPCRIEDEGVDARQRVEGQVAVHARRRRVGAGPAGHEDGLVPAAGDVG